MQGLDYLIMGFIAGILIFILQRTESILRVLENKEINSKKLD